MNWWMYKGYPDFKAGADGYPLPGSVVKYYRERKKVTQNALSYALGRSKNTVRLVQNRGANLDTFSLRYRLCDLYDIPPLLLGLDHVLTPAWWVDKETPRPGQVIKYYRRLMKKDDGKPWTQPDLAVALDITDKAVRDMENKDISLDSITRRRILSSMLKIPPAFLGLASLEALVPALSSTRLTEYLQPDMQSYALALPSYWEKHLNTTAKGDVAELLLKIGALHDAILYAEGQDKDTMLELLCRYHILVAFITDDHPRFHVALLHLDRAVLLARSLQKKELYAVSLYRRGNALFIKGDTTEAIKDYRLSLEYVASEQLKGALLLKLGQAQAKAAQTREEFTQALKILDKGGKIAQKGSFEGDEHFLRLKVDRYHLDKASSLIHSPQPSLRFPDEALNELTWAAGPDVTCRSAYNTILQARAYIEKGLYPIASTLAEEALPTVKAIQSGVNLARINFIYVQLRGSSYGNSPDVARLGMKLY